MFRWLLPPLIDLAPDQLEAARAYEAEHSLPAYPDEVEPPPVVWDRILAAIQSMPVLPAYEVEEDGSDFWLELWDDARRGK